MATQTTGGGSVTSFTNTPQAKDDTYTYLEDVLRANSTLYNAATNTITLDVMANDLGGNAKTLFSVDDGDGNPITADFDLLYKDIDGTGTSAWERTFCGNWVRISNGKVEYRIAIAGDNDPNHALSVDALTAGQNFCDQFVYSIRLGNGTLSEATVKINITGANDAAAISPVTGGDYSVVEAGGVANGNPGDPNACGTLSVSDADLGENKFQTPSSLSGTYGTFTFDPCTGKWTYTLNNNLTATQGLYDGQHVTDTLSVNSYDGTAHYNIVVNITGSNDAPVLNAITSISYTDTGADDTFAAATGTLTATDPDAGDTKTFGISGGVADNSHAGYNQSASNAYGTLYLNTSSGAYTFIPNDGAIEGLDDGQNPSPTFTLTVTDTLGLSNSQTLTINLHGANDTPVLGTVTDATINDTAANDVFADVTGTLTSSDRDASDTPSYSVAGGGSTAEAGFDQQVVTAYGTLYLNSSTGDYKFVADNAAIQALDDGESHNLDFTVSVSDGTASASDTLTITVNGANDNPIAVNDTGSGFEDTTITGNVGTNDSDVDDSPASLSYSLNAPAPAGFTLNPDGSWTLDASNAAYQHLAVGETEDVVVGYTVSDGHGGSDTATLTVTVTGVNDAPTLTKDASGWSYDAANGHYYKFVSQPGVNLDSALAGSHAQGGYLATVADAAENAFITSILGSDARLGGGDAAVEGTFRWIDGPEQGQLITYTNWSAGEPNNLGDEDNIQIHQDGTWNDLGVNNPGLGGYVVERNGDLTLEEQTDGAADENILVHTGSGSLSFTDVDTSDTHTASYVANGSGYVGTFAVSIDEGLDKLNWNFSVADSALDHLASGQVVTQSYTVTVDDGHGGTADQIIVVTLIGTNDAPVVASAISDQSSAEDTAWSFTVPAGTFTDVDDGTVLTYSATLGNGSALPSWLTFNAATQTFSGTPPQDFNGNIDLKVTASDGIASASDTFTLTITPVNDAPVIASNGGGATASISVAENTTAVTTVHATDVDGDSITYSIVGGADAAKFTINASTGALSFVSAPDFENPTDAGTNNVYDVTVQASDGSLVDTQAIAVTVTNVNEAPTITSNGGGDTASVSVAENTTAVTTVTATDPDAGTTLTYSIVGGADAAKFTINSSTGALSFVSAPNFEAPTDSGTNNVYDVTVQASDGSLVDTQAIAVTVTNVNAAPVISSNGGGATASVSVSENSTAVTTIVATDDGENNGTLTYSIVGGADAAKFTINSSTGALSFVSAPNFEAPTDSGANNVYDVTVQASDGSLVDTQAIAVTVTNVNAAPIITSNGGGATASVSVAENTTAVTTVIATDDGENNGTLTYSIVGGADAAKFTIDSSTGALSFVSAPDFENPTDSGANNVYDVTVRASDGSLSDDQAIAVTVTNVAENSLFLAINIGGPEGQDVLNFANFTITIGSTVYHLSDLIVAPGSVNYVPGSTGFALGPGGNNARVVVFEIPNAPASGAAQVHFDYSSSNNGNTTNDGPVFSIGTTAAAATQIANYANTTSPTPWVGNVSTNARTISFNYTVSGSTVNVSSVVDPIILDLGSHGISLSNTVLFDMDGDGHAQGVAWTNGEDGVLAVDLNGNGQIDSGNEILSPWFNGGGFAHSLDALASLDSNADGVIDANDAAFGALRVWVDANSNGVTDVGELMSLGDLGITGISLGTVAGTGAIDGQNVLAAGTFTYADGSSGDFSAVELTETINTRVFNGQGTEDVVGTEGDDLLFASNLGNALYGGGGNDTLYSGAGNDTLSGGDGNDTFVLANAGIDTITDYASGDKIDITSLLNVASGTDVLADGYLRVTTTGLLQVDVDGGGDNWVTVANVNVGPASYSIAYGSGDSVATIEVAPVAPPIGVDLDGDGHVSFLATDAGATFDYGAGRVATAWVAGNDGILVRDANHDGQVAASEMVFATGGSDLQGLAVYDSNHDGVLNAQDAAFGEFAVWQDANSNGVVDKGEMVGLTALGITGISLSSDGIGYSAANGDVSVVGTGSFTYADGRTGVLADAVFATGALTQQDQARMASASNSNAALLGAIAAAGLVAAEPLAAATAEGHEAVTHGLDPMTAPALALSPIAANAVAKLVAAEQLAQLSPEHVVSADHGTSLHFGDPSGPVALFDSGSSHDLRAPADLLQATEAPQHEQIVASSPLTAGAVFMPSAEQLMGQANAGLTLHNEVVGKVLADAIHVGGGEVDTLLASLPTHGGEANALLTAISSHGGEAFAMNDSLGFSLAQNHAVFETLMMHQDAAPHA